MEREEPTTCLVYALSDEVGGEDLATLDLFTMLEGVVYLRKRHSTRVKPYVDQVALTTHRTLAVLSHECDLIDVGTVQVDLVIVLLAVVSRGKACERIDRHDASLYSALALLV